MAIYAGLVVIEPSDKKKLREERVYLAHTSRSQSLLRKVRVGAEAEGMEERCLLPCSACLLRQAIRTSCPGVALSVVSGLPC